MDDVSVLEMYLRSACHRPGRGFDLFDRRKLTKEPQSRVKLAYERLAHHDLREGSQQQRRRSL